MNPEKLNAAWREYYEERAAIREYHGNQFRAEAERDAMVETIEAMARENKSGQLRFDNV